MCRERFWRTRGARVCTWRSDGIPPFPLSFSEILLACASGSYQAGSLLLHGLLQGFGLVGFFPGEELELVATVFAFDAVVVLAFIGGAAEVAVLGGGAVDGLAELEGLDDLAAVSYTHLRAHETPEHL